jgi:hypothetical protein
LGSVVSLGILTYFLLFTEEKRDSNCGSWILCGIVWISGVLWHCFWKARRPRPSYVVVRPYPSGDAAAKPVFGRAAETGCLTWHSRALHRMRLNVGFGTVRKP